eukprot:TRINITY_DN5792_c0_g4_i1.p1 TRINITY_DN5792_c0_g4~~TRINITY_DN5792_c0_g4_i1.p1  ORF type:complete len:345 (+),score=86.47 TRINITY_DN5792_c0_g4_i1:32-1066(+)
MSRGLSTVFGLSAVAGGVYYWYTHSSLAWPFLSSDTASSDANTSANMNGNMNANTNANASPTIKAASLSSFPSTLQQQSPSNTSGGSAKQSGHESSQQYIAHVNQCMQMMDTEIARIDSQVLRVTSQKLKKTLYLQITLQRIRWLGHLSIITAVWNYLYASPDVPEASKSAEITSMDALAVLDPHNDGNSAIYMKGNETFLKWFSKLNATYGTAGKAFIWWKCFGRGLTLERSLEQIESEFVDGLDAGDVVFVYNAPKRLGIIVGYERTQDGSVNLLVISHEDEQKGLFRVRVNDLHASLSRKDLDFNVYQPEKGFQRFDSRNTREKTDCIIAFRANRTSETTL